VLRRLGAALPGKDRLTAEVRDRLGSRFTESNRALAEAVDWDLTQLGYR
jgi:hypothetical protein